MALVAAAAMALFTVSAVVALEGWPGMQDSPTQPALVVGEDDVVEGRGSSTERPHPLVLREPRKRAKPEPARQAVAADREKPTARAPEADRSPVERLRAPEARPEPKPKPKAEPEADPAPEPRPKDIAEALDPVTGRTGDAVRKVGDGLSGTVRGAGDALETLAAPVSPETGKALNDLTNFLAGLVQRTVGLVGSTLDQAPRRSGH